MANTIQINRSTTAGATPSLDAGELGVNLTDRKLWVGGNGAGNIALGGDGLFLKADGLPDAHTKLLIHSDTHDGSTTFTDASGSGHTVTSVGANAHRTANKKFGATSIEFVGDSGSNGGGTTAKLDIDSVPALGTGDWTIDCWVRFKDLTGTYCGIAENYTGGTSGSWIVATFSSTKKVGFYAQGSGGISWVYGNTVLAVDTWYHVAIVHSSQNLKIYLNGVNDSSTAGGWSTTNNAFSRPGVNVGASHHTNNPDLDGYLDEFRISKGIARWTANFTPPTRPYSYVDLNSNLNVAGYLEAPNIDGKPDAYTKLLIHSDTTDGRGTFTDSSPSGHAITKVSDPTHETEKSKFGASSLYFDGGDSLTVADHDDVNNFGTGDFTIDFWFNSSVTNQRYTSFFSTEGTGGGYTLLLNNANTSDGTIAYWGGLGSDVRTSSGGYNDGNWHHVALVRNGTSLAIYVDGVSKATATSSAAETDGSNTLIIGDSYYANRGLTGYMDELRISKGIARWTAAFTPPTRPYATFSAGDGLFTGELLTPRLLGSATTNFDITTNTKDGADNKRVRICGGGAAGWDRGAGIQMLGNEYPSNGASLFLQAGNAGSGDIRFATGGADRVKISNAGVLYPVANGEDLGTTDNRWKLFATSGDFSGAVTGTTAAFSGELDLDAGLEWANTTAATNIHGRLGYGTDHIYVGAQGSTAILKLMSGGTVACTFAANHDATFTGDVTVSGDLAVTGTIDCDTLDGLDSSQVLQSGQDGAYYTFNGVNEYVEIPDLRPVVSANATMAAWVTVDDRTVANRFGHHRDKRFYIWITGGYLGVGVADQNNISATAGKTTLANRGIANGQWFHVAVVADGGTARAYINGVQDSTFSYTQSTSTDPDANILIGKLQDATAYNWTGKTRDVKIYPSALSATEIAKLYSGENPKRNVDMVTAPDFDSTYWSVGTGWSVGPGWPGGTSGATHSGTLASYITQTPRENYVNGAQYVATCDVGEVYGVASGTSLYLVNHASTSPVDVAFTVSGGKAYAIWTQGSVNLSSTNIYSTGNITIRNLKITRLNCLVDYTPRSATNLTWYNTAIPALYNGSVYSYASLSKGSTDHYVGGDLRIEGNITSHTNFTRNVGIGTETPFNPNGFSEPILDVRAGVSGAGSAIYVGSADSATNSSFIGQWGVSAYHYNRAAGDIIFGTSNTARMRLSAAGTLFPEVNGTQDLGASSKQWNNIYSEAGTFTGQLSIDSSSTTHNTIASYGRYGPYHSCDVSTGYGLYIARNLNEAGSHPLANFVDSHATNTQTTVYINHVGSSGYGLDCVGAGRFSGALTGTSATFNSTGLANAPTLAIDNTSSNTYIHSLEAFTANITSGQTNILVVGKEGSTKNAGYIGYKWSGAGSDANLLTLGHWGANHLLTISGAGAATFSGALSVSGSQTINGSQFYFYRAVNSGNPEFHIGSAAAERLTIQSVFASGAQTLAYVSFRTSSSLNAANAGQMNFYVDDSSSEILKIQDTGITSTGLTVSGAAQFNTIGSNLVGAISTMFDLGTASLKWRNLNMSGTATIGGGVSVTGSSSFQGAAFSSALTGTTGTFSGRIVGLTAGFGNTTDAVHLGHETGYGIVQGTNTSGTVFCGLRLRTQGYAITIPNAAAPDVTIENNLNVSGTGTSTFASDISTPALWYRPTAAVVHCWQPKNGYYHAGGNVHTGAIRIKLPPIHDAMVSFWVDVYDYANNESFSAYITGYPYAGTAWSWTSAVILGGVDRNFTVRFGDNNVAASSSSEYYVYIGETNSTWNHPQVVVRDVFSGYATSSADWDGGDAGWTVSFVTSFQNVAQTQSNTLPYGDFNKLINLDSGTKSLSLGGLTVTGSSSFQGAAFSSGITGTTATFSGDISADNLTKNAWQFIFDYDGVNRWNALRQNSGGGTHTYDQTKTALKIYRSSGYIGGLEISFGHLIDSDVYTKLRLRGLNVLGAFYIKFKYHDDTYDSGWQLSGWNPTSWTEADVSIPAGKLVKGLYFNSSSGINGAEWYIKWIKIFSTTSAYEIGTPHGGGDIYGTKGVLTGALTGTSATFTGGRLTVASTTNESIIVDNTSIGNSGISTWTWHSFKAGGTRKWRVFGRGNSTAQDLEFWNDAQSVAQLALGSDGASTFSGALTGTTGTFSGALAVGNASAASYEKLLVKEGGAVTYSHANNRHGAIIATTGSGAFALNSSWVNNWHKIGGLFVSSEITNNYANYGIVAIGQSNGGTAWGGSFSAEDIHASGTAYGVHIKKVTANTRYGIYDQSGAPWYTSGSVGIGSVTGIWKLYVNGITKINGALEVNGQLAPSAGDTYNLGNSTNTWKNLYISESISCATFSSSGDSVVGGTLTGAAATFSGALAVDGGIKDKNNSTGSASHVLHSDGLNRVYWTTAPSATIPSSVPHKYYTYIQLDSSTDYYTITHSLGESDVIVAVRRAISGTATRSARFAADAGVHLDVGYDVQVISCDANGAASTNHVSLYFDSYSVVHGEYVYVTVIG
jgi:hypothetical protein